MSSSGSTQASGSHFSCSSNSAHVTTDQREWIGCRECSAERFSASTGSFFTSKHLYEPGDLIRPQVSYFTYDPRKYTVSIQSTGDQIIIDSPRDFVDHWMDPGRGELRWNKLHESANWVVGEVGYGAAGSGSTMVGEFTQELRGILVAKALDQDAHGYPIDPSGSATKDLVTWPWICSCGAKAPPDQSVCLACQQTQSGST